MDIQINRKGALCYVYIKSFFGTDEYALVQKEVQEVKRFAGQPETTSTAAIDGVYKKRGTGVFLDALYQNNRAGSDILKGFNKLFHPEFCQILSEHESSFFHLQKSNRDSTLVNYYSNGGYYEPHFDLAALTAVWFGSIGEVTGGDFVFPDYDVAIKLEENSLVLFHGCIKHGATPVVADENSCRVSIAKFIGYR